MARSFPQIAVFPLRNNTDQFRISAFVGMGDMGGFFRKSWDDFPREPYLAADANRTAELRQRLQKGPDRKLVVGISWRSLNPKAGEHKTAQLSDLTLLHQPDVTCVDLQYGDTKAELEIVRRDLGFDIAHFDDIDNTNEIDSLAALIDACDIVLTTSNTTAHIAGALGKPVWIMVPYGQGRIWYWFRDRSDSPWYPGARIVRQQPGQSWADLVASTVPEILKFARELKTRPD